MGLDRVLLAMQGEGVPLPPLRTPVCFVVAMGPQAHPRGAELVRDLREAGIPAIGAFEDRPLKAQLKMADRSGAQYAAILGDAEVAAGTVSLRHLADGTQESILLADLAPKLGAAK
jgi:histidyl-tRNA synthetase